MKVRFAVFDAGTGLPLRWGICRDGDLASQAQDGEIAVEWLAEHGDPASWRLIDGEAVPS